ncbi:hypothetical protein KJ785_01920, partial [Patescibacteria group bacterium]|nr:hypothetical protein [Patescibacteria group bacterium]
TIIGIGETCDDGNAVGGDGCSASCEKEGKCVPEGGETNNYLINEYCGSKDFAICKSSTGECDWEGEENTGICFPVISDKDFCEKYNLDENDCNTNKCKYILISN